MHQSTVLQKVHRNSRLRLARASGASSSRLDETADAIITLLVNETADCKAYDTLISLPEQAPQELLADKGYDADAIRNDLASGNLEPVIPGRANRRVQIE